MPTIHTETSMLATSNLVMLFLSKTKNFSNVVRDQNEEERGKKKKKIDRKNLSNVVDRKENLVMCKFWVSISLAITCTWVCLSANVVDLPRYD